jgi:hypothetical protein
MSTIIHSRITGAMLILLIVACGIVWTLYGRLQDERSERVSYENLLRSESAKAKVWKDEYGQWRYRAETAEIRSSEALKTLSRTDARFKSIQEDFELVKKNLKNLESASFTGTRSGYQVSTSSSDTIFVIAGDTSKARYFMYRDTAGWFSTEGVMLENGMVPVLKFQCRDSLVTVVTKKRRWFRRPLFEQEIKSMNPHTHVGYSKSVIVKRR